MHLLRVQIPDFRVLKDVDITFEKEFSPRIFPLGSQNGGGKSTLLQLIFVLLHCPGAPERLPFLRNMLRGFKPSENESKKVLATIDIWDGEEEVRMEFFSCRDSYLNDEDDGANNDLTFSVIPEHKAVGRKISRLKKKISSSQKLDDSYNVVTASSLIDESNIQEYQREIERESRLESELLKQNDKYKKLLGDTEKVWEYLGTKNLTYITKYSANDDGKEVLLCKIESLDISKAQSFLDRLSKKVFLAAPFTQVYLFLPQQVRKRLFRKISPDSEDYYYSELEEAKFALPGFFTYDFSPVNLIIETLKAARDKDTDDLIKTGAYGNRFKPILDDLNSVLAGKTLNVRSDLSKVIFEIHRGDDEITELYPEDMSHGELKRLSLYMWTKYRQTENAIVLMDEIEIAFHPDWQYQIVRDLMQWAPDSQHILATHSFDLCEALPPFHVKELEPKLLKQASD